MTSSNVKDLKWKTLSTRLLSLSEFSISIYVLSLFNKKLKIIKIKNK